MQKGIGELGELLVEIINWEELMLGCQGKDEILSRRWRVSRRGEAMPVQRSIPSKELEVGVGH